MNKRSRVLLVILIVVVLLMFVSAFNFYDKENDKELVIFEEEIVDPNNELDPLNQNINSDVLLIEVALKTEKMIDKIFGFFVNIVKGITDKII